MKPWTVYSNKSCVMCVRGSGEAPAAGHQTRRRNGSKRRGTEGSAGGGGEDGGRAEGHHPETHPGDRTAGFYLILFYIERSKSDRSVCL